MSESRTPRTDAGTHLAAEFTHEAKVCEVYVAAQLESDLAAARAEVERLKDALQEIANGATSAYEDAWCGDIANAALAAQEQAKP